MLPLLHSLSTPSGTPVKHILDFLTESSISFIFCSVFSIFLPLCASFSMVSSHLSSFPLTIINPFIEFLIGFLYFSVLWYLIIFLFCNVAFKLSISLCKILNSAFISLDTVVIALLQVVSNNSNIWDCTLFYHLWLLLILTSIFFSCALLACVLSEHFIWNYYFEN